MIDPLRARVAVLIAEWRTRAPLLPIESMPAEIMRECAHDLDAALRAAPEVDIGVPVDPDLVRVDLVEPGMVRITAVRTGQSFLHRVVPESPESRVARAAAPEGEETPAPAHGLRCATCNHFSADHRTWWGGDGRCGICGCETYHPPIAAARAAAPEEPSDAP